MSVFLHLCVHFKGTVCLSVSPWLYFQGLVYLGLKYSPRSREKEVVCLSSSSVVGLPRARARLSASSPQFFLELALLAQSGCRLMAHPVQLPKVPSLDGWIRADAACQQARRLVEGTWLGVSPATPSAGARVQLIGCTEALLFPSPHFVHFLLHTFPCVSWLAPSSNRRLSALIF